MNKKMLFAIAVVLLAIAGCKDTDNAAKWVGTYNVTTGGLYASSFNRIVIQESNNHTLQVAIDTALPSGTVYTYANLLNVSVQSATAATFNETDSVLGYSHPLLLSGTATLNGSTLTFSGTGVNSYDTVAYYFYGAKQ